MNEIAKVAFHGMNSEDIEVKKACLEKIYIMVTEGLSEEASAQKMINDQKDRIKADDQLGFQLVKKYGDYKGYPKFILALNYFQMSNDRFYEIYSFNFVPLGQLYDIAKDYIEKRQAEKSIITSAVSSVAAPNGCIDLNRMNKMFSEAVKRNSFRLGV